MEDEKGSLESQRRVAEAVGVNAARRHVFLCCDQTRCAVDAMLHRRNLDAAYFDNIAGIFCHRPYDHMPVTAMAIAYMSCLRKTPGGQRELAHLCQQAQIPLANVIADFEQPLDAFRTEAELDQPFMPAAMALTKLLRQTPEYKSRIATKMKLGNPLMRQLGNLYTAALPAWLAAGLEAAAQENLDLTNRELLVLGYGSGDAAEAMPVTVQPGWQDVAQNMALTSALEPVIDLTQPQYNTLHHQPNGAALPPMPQPFEITKIGNTHTSHFQDAGVEYYGIGADLPGLDLG